MYVNDPVGDMLTRIRNGQNAKKSKVLCPASKERIAVLEVLKREGYIRGFEKQDVRKGISNVIIELKYSDGSPVITFVRRISTPGRRTYSSVGDLGYVRNGLGIKILSTSKGVVSDIEARQSGVGGEIICEVF